MSVKLEPEIEAFSENSVRRLSLGPLSRRFEDESGAVWIAHPVGESRTRAGKTVRRVSLHSLEHPSRVMDLPPGRTLGDLKNKELVNLT